MDAMQRARQWAEEPCFDEATRAEARAIMADEDQLVRCFGRELAFGTGGLRGVLGVGTNRMNDYTVAKASEGLARYLVKNGGTSVAVSYDSRIGSRRFAGVTAGVLAAHGIACHLYDRLLPTPMLSFAVRALGCGAGVMITASHNPSQYNGYKVYGADGCQITEAAADAITAEIEAADDLALRWLREDEAREKGLLSDIPASVYDDFMARTMACRRFVSDAPLRVCYTPLNGTGREPVLDAFSRMPGLAVIPVAEQLAPDGRFPTCPKPNPELKEALTLALQTAARENAALVVATDPDCDRLGVAVRDATGEFTILTGNEVGLLLLEHLLRRRAEDGSLPARPVVIKTIVTSDLAFAIARRHGAEVREVLTGFKYIGEEIGRLEAAGEADRFVFGFEESCGYLAGTHVRDKDGVMAATLVCALAQQLAAQGRTLLDALAELYAAYGCMQNRLLNFDLDGADPMAVMRAVMEALRREPLAELADRHVTATKDYLAGVDGLPTSDVLSYAGEGVKAIVRPSGTEPKVKVYLCARADTRPAAQRLLDEMEAQLRARIRA